MTDSQSLFPDEIRFSVTVRNVINGRPSNVRECAVALAVREEIDPNSELYDEAGIEVEGDRFTLYQEGFMCAYELDDDVRSFIDRFDAATGAKLDMIAELDGNPLMVLVSASDAEQVPEWLA